MRLARQKSIEGSASRQVLLYTLREQEENAVLKWLNSNYRCFGTKAADIGSAFRSNLPESDRRAVLEWLGIADNKVESTDAESEQVFVSNLPNENTKLTTVAWVAQCRAVMVGYGLSSMEKVAKVREIVPSESTLTVLKNMRCGIVRLSESTVIHASGFAGNSIGLAVSGRRGCWRCCFRGYPRRSVAADSFSGCFRAYQRLGSAVGQQGWRGRIRPKYLGSNRDRHRPDLYEDSDA